MSTTGRRLANPKLIPLPNRSLAHILHQGRKKGQVNCENPGPDPGDAEIQSVFHWIASFCSFLGFWCH